MQLMKHSELEGRHAFLAPSNYHWINYDQDKLDSTYVARLQAARGSREHDLAKNLIELGIILPRTKKTLNMYVNDAIGYRMTPEQPLYYSEHCFGHADALCFRRSKLRIHDLKTGKTPTSVHQLEVYAALFCLEYKFKPTTIDIELRIYQNDEVQIWEADPVDIVGIMDKIVTYSKRIDQIREEAL